MKVDSFDTHFKSNSSSIENVVGLLGIELTAQTGLLGIELTSPSMNIKAFGLLTALGMFPFISLAQFLFVLIVPPGLVYHLVPCDYKCYVLIPPAVVQSLRLSLDFETICS
jgi:hypothetical protein